MLPLPLTYCPDATRCRTHGGGLQAACGGGDGTGISTPPISLG